MNPKYMHNTFNGYILPPADVDVSCGKTSTNKHPGDLLFRQLVLSKVGDHMLFAEKARNSLIMANILKDLEKNRGRFMKIDKNAQLSRAIRDRIPERKADETIMSDLAVLMTPNVKISKKKPEKAFHMKKSSRKQSLKHVKDKAVLQGNEDALTLRAALLSHGRVVSEDDESAPTADETYLSLTSPSYLNKQLSPSAFHDDADVQDDSSVFLDDYNDLMVGDLEHCGLMLDDAEHLSSPFHGDDDVHAFSSVFLDGSNDLMVVSDLDYCDLKLDGAEHFSSPFGNNDDVRDRLSFSTTTRRTSW